jgi:uncharacterized membrane protein
MMAIEKNARTRTWIAVCLSAGVYSSATLLALGLVGVLVAGETNIPLSATPGGLVRQALRGNAGAILHLGLWLLLITPILRVLAAALGFWMEGDRRYFAVACSVLGIILSGLWLALRV